MENKNETKDREIIVSRLLDAPIELVWKAWIEPEHIAKWWGPDGFTNTISKMELKAGGEWDLVMHGPDGKNYDNKSRFKEVVKQERIVYEHVSYPNFISTITFVPEGNKTFLKWHMLFESAELFEQVVKNFKADEGLRQNVNKLEAFLGNMATENTTELVITREYKAPRELVYKAWTDGERLAKWWGPAGMSMGVAKMDFRPGGEFHYSMKTPDGFEMWGKFVYREFVAPEKIVFVNSFSDGQGGITRAPFSASWPLEVLNTVTFSEKDGITTMTIKGGPINATEEEINTFRNSLGNMQQGFKGTFDQLEEYLAEIAK